MHRYVLVTVTPARDVRTGRSSTWVIATRPQAHQLWRDRSVLWGGVVPDLYLLPRKTAALERRLHRLLPEVDAQADYAWCGSCPRLERGVDERRLAAPAGFRPPTGRLAHLLAPRAAHGKRQRPQSALGDLTTALVAPPVAPLLEP